MYALASRVTLILAIPALLAAQDEKPRPEIGFRSGWMKVTTNTPFGDDSFSAIVIPNGMFPATGGVHALFFPSARFGLEPQLGVFRASDDDSDPFTLTMLAIQGNVFLGPDATKAPYAFIHIARIQESDGGNGDGQTGIGGGLGYRKVHRESIAMRYELRFRRFDQGSGITTNEIGVLVGVGAVIRKKAP